MYAPDVVRGNDGKYYLYYCGSVDPGETAVGAENLNKRTRIQQNQKIGVLCFESIDDFRKGKYSQIKSIRII